MQFLGCSGLLCCLWGVLGGFMAVSWWVVAVVGLMNRALDLKPEVTQGCGFESRL